MAALLPASLEGADTDAAEASDAGMSRRAAQLETGEVSGVPIPEAFAEVERRLKA